MFPLPPDAISKRLTPEESSLLFETLWEKLSHKFFKFERLQSYQEPDNSSLQAFLARDYELARREMIEARAKDAKLYIELCRKGIEFVRVRAVELPLSDYLRWELETYQIS